MPVRVRPQVEAVLRVSDEQLRAAARRSVATGAVEDQARDIAARIRTRRLERARVGFAAVLGHEAARAALGMELGCVVHGQEAVTWAGWCDECHGSPWHPNLAWRLAQANGAGGGGRHWDHFREANRGEQAEALVRAALAAVDLSWRDGWSQCQCIECEESRRAPKQALIGPRAPATEGGERDNARWMCAAAVMADNMRHAGHLAVRVPGDGNLRRNEAAAAGLREFVERGRFVGPVFLEGGIPCVENVRGAFVSDRYGGELLPFLNGATAERWLRPARDGGHDAPEAIRAEFTGDGDEVVIGAPRVWANATTLLRAHVPAPLVPWDHVGRWAAPGQPLWAWPLAQAVCFLRLARTNPGVTAHYVSACCEAVAAIVSVELEQRLMDPRLGAAGAFVEPGPHLDGMRLVRRWGGAEAFIVSRLTEWALADSA